MSHTNHSPSKCHCWVCVCRVLCWDGGSVTWWPFTCIRWKIIRWKVIMWRNWWWQQGHFLFIAQILFIIKCSSWLKQMLILDIRGQVLMQPPPLLVPAVITFTGRFDFHRTSSTLSYGWHCLGPAPDLTPRWVTSSSVLYIKAADLWYKQPNSADQVTSYCLSFTVSRHVSVQEFIGFLQ